MHGLDGGAMSSKIPSGRRNSGTNVGAVVKAVMPRGLIAHLSKGRV